MSQFGERYYKCNVGVPGVGYRFLPRFADKVCSLTAVDKYDSLAAISSGSEFLHNCADADAGG